MAQGRAGNRAHANVTAARKARFGDAPEPRALCVGGGLGIACDID
jgi:hypothetical protein